MNVNENVTHIPVNNTKKWIQRLWIFFLQIKEKGAQMCWKMLKENKILQKNSEKEVKTISTI